MMCQPVTGRTHQIRLHMQVGVVVQLYCFVVVVFVLWGGGGGGMCGGWWVGTWCGKWCFGVIVWHRGGCGGGSGGGGGDICFSATFRLVR